MQAEDEAVKEIIGAIARVAEIWGFSSALGALYGIMYFSDKPMSLDELVKESGYSKSTVSVNMHLLEHWRAVKKHKKPGDKKVFYVAEGDMGKLVREIIEVNVKRETEIMIESLATAKRMIKEKGASKSISKKIEELENIYQLHKQLVDVISNLPPEKIEKMLREFTNN